MGKKIPFKLTVDEYSTIKINNFYEKIKSDASIIKLKSSNVESTEFVFLLIILVNHQ